jgi:hypothetical protein
MFGKKKETKVKKEAQYWLPNDKKIEETMNIEGLSTQELKQRSVLYLRVAEEWNGHDADYTGGYAALSSAFAMQALLRMQNV